MRKIVLSFVCIVVTCIASHAQGIEFESGTWEQIIRKAKAENKVIFVDVYTQWCAPCKYVSENVFPDKELGDVYNQRFVNFKIDAESPEGKKFVKNYPVSAYPTFLYIDGKSGKILYKMIGSKDVAGFISAVKNIPNPSALNAYSEGGLKFASGTWDEILRKAKAENKIIFVDLYTQWCGPCKYVSENVFPEKELGDFYNLRFINYKMDAETPEGKKFKKAYPIVAYPTFFFIDANNGKIIHRVVGSRNVEGFISEAKKLPMYASHGGIDNMLAAIENGTASKELLYDFYVSSYEWNKTGALDVYAKILPREAKKLTGENDRMMDEIANRHKGLMTRFKSRFDYYTATEKKNRLEALGLYLKGPSTEELIAGNNRLINEISGCHREVMVRLKISRRSSNPSAGKKNKAEALDLYLKALTTEELLEQSNRLMNEVPLYNKELVSRLKALRYADYETADKKHKPEALNLYLKAFPETELVDSSSNLISEISHYDKELMTRLVDETVKTSQDGKCANKQYAEDLEYAAFNIQRRISIFLNKSIKEGNLKLFNELLELKERFANYKGGRLLDGDLNIAQGRGSFYATPEYNKLCYWTQNRDNEEEFKSTLIPYMDKLISENHVDSLIKENHNSILNMIKERGLNRQTIVYAPFILEVGNITAHNIIEWTDYLWKLSPSDEKTRELCSKWINYAFNMNRFNDKAAVPAADLLARIGNTKDAKIILEKAIASQKELQREDRNVFKNLELKLRDINNGKL